VNRDGTTKDSSRDGDGDGGDGGEEAPYGSASTLRPVTGVVTPTESQKTEADQQKVAASQGAGI